MPDPDMNGAPPAMAIVTETLHLAIEQQTQRRDQLVAELEAVRRELTNYTKALKLVDEAAAPLPPTAPKKKAPSGTKIGPENLAEIKDAVLGWVAENGDVQFRQVDIRERIGVNSSLASSAFAQLREQGVIRLAGKQGLNHYYRLTHAAVAEQA